jgi:hypothetical protein
MKIKGLKKLFFLSFFAISCTYDPKPIEKIYGKWQGQKWLIDGKEFDGFDVSIIKFEFKPDSFYIAKMAGQSEEGTFNLHNNCFNAVSIYGSPKKCPILRLERDTMVWLMDSVGQPGQLYLVRVKERG